MGFTEAKVLAKRANLHVKRYRSNFPESTLKGIKRLGFKAPSLDRIDSPSRKLF
jgi:hypothetical protein